MLSKIYKQLGKQMNFWIILIGITIGGEYLLQWHPLCSNGDEYVTEDAECEVDEDISGRNFSSTLEWSDEIGDMIVIEEDGIEA
jgi:hypothetical protein